jgi:hypothetical protein
MRRDSGLSPGDLGDPVADAIRNEQREAARPTASEIEEAKQAHYTCDRCETYDEDAVALRMNENYIPDCSAIQKPREPMGSLCEECYDPTTKTDKIVEKLGNDDIDYVVEYECGVLKGVSGEFDGDKRPQGWYPEVPVRHRRGGHPIETIWTVDDLDKLSGNND